MATRRPISPHLQVYRFQLTMALSITHRATGIVLGVGAPVFVYWLLAIAAGPAAYQQVQALLTSPAGVIGLAAWTFALFYHLCNGIRHLVWDAGRGLDIVTTYRSGYAVVAAALLLTVVTLFSAWTGGPA